MTGDSRAPDEDHAGWPDDVPARSAHVTPRQVDYWRRSGLVHPGAGELTQVRAIAALRRAGMSLRRIRAVVERLPTPGAAPLRELRFAVQGRELFVQHSSGAWEGDRRPGQLILDHVLPLQPVDGAAVPAYPPAETAAARRGGRPQPTGREPASPAIRAATDAGAVIRRYLAAERVRSVSRDAAG
jgi:DNA-binding transcriptional MerR regulator